MHLKNVFLNLIGMNVKTKRMLSLFSLLYDIITELRNNDISGMQ